MSSIIMARIRVWAHCKGQNTCLSTSLVLEYMSEYSISKYLFCGLHVLVHHNYIIRIPHVGDACL